MTELKDMKETVKILKEMCKRVKADYSKINFKKRDWFSKHSWTEVEQDKFKEWMVRYLMKNAKARNEVMAYPIKNKEMIEKTVGMFVFNYGWKLE